jgi:hypothetical protein
VPGEANVFIDADLSQIELVILAYILDLEQAKVPVPAGV